jgi:5'-3' exonuclease
MTVQVGEETVQVGDIYGVCQCVVSSLKLYPGSEIVFVEDDFPEDRMSEMETYKEGRVRNPDVWLNTDDLKSALGCCKQVFFAKKTGYEADDTMARLFFIHREKRNVIIVSGDNDMAQLICKGARVSRKIEKGQFVWLSEEYLLEKYGVPSGCLIQYRTLVGDPSDKIPPAVPRLDRMFARQFADIWAREGIKVALQTMRGHPGVQKVIQNIEAVKRNHRLMNLIHRHKDSNELVPMEVPVFSHTTLSRLQLRGFQQFLESRNLHR